ncbi:MAG: hypothetical protein AB7I04_18455 [Pseudomonadales bacterium]
MEPRVVIGIPHIGDLPDYFFKSVIGMRKGRDPYLVTVRNHPIDIARNLIVEAFKAQGDATHLLMLDADMTFPADTLPRLLQLSEDLGAHVVSGTYFARSDTPVPHVYMFDNERDGVKYYRTLGPEFSAWLKAHPEHRDQGNESLFEPSPVKCDAVGAGVLLMTREVLDAVEEAHAESYKPWFECAPGSRGGEDFEFCRRVSALGYQVWADFGLQCNHNAPGNFMGREEFIEAFAIGTEDEYDFVTPIVVEISPDGRRRPRLPGREKVRA